MYSHY